jgi:DNA-binding transcriptional ArsR family regulator
MVVRQESDDHADRLFQALADATRREIVALTLTGEHSVSDLARRFPMSFAAVQKHVAVLERAGLVTKQRQGREQRVRGNADALREAHRLLDQLAAVWRGRIDRIGAILADPDPGDSKEHAHGHDRRPEES